MNRENAIKYLLKKDKLKFTKKCEQDIDEVMTKGKIYGDPVARIQW